MHGLVSMIGLEQKPHYIHSMLKKKIYKKIDIKLQKQKLGSMLDFLSRNLILSHYPTLLIISSFSHFIILNPSYGVIGKMDYEEQIWVLKELILSKNSENLVRSQVFRGPQSQVFQCCFIRLTQFLFIHTMLIYFVAIYCLLFKFISIYIFLSLIVDYYAVQYIKGTSIIPLKLIGLGG